MRPLARLLALALMAAIALMVPARAEASELLANERYTLANGLDVVLIVDRRLPLVAVDLSYHVGSGHDDSKPGLAHLVEHLMFRGTRDVADGEYFDLIAAAGGHTNGTTRRTRSSYFTTLPSNQLPLVLWLEANRMAWLLSALDAAKVREEIATTSDEWRFRIGSNRRGGDLVDLATATYTEARAWALAEPDEIARLTLADVRGFVERYHGPQNATLVLVGDLPADIHEQIEHYFGRRRGGERPSLPKISPVVATQEQRIVRESEHATNPAVIVAWPTPAVFEPGDAEADMLASILDERMSTAAAARGDSEVLGLSVGQDSELGGSELQIFVEGATWTTPERLLAFVDEALAQLAAVPVSAEELDRARKTMQLGTYRGLQALDDRARRVQIYVGAGKPADWLDHDLARYDRLTAAALEDARAALLQTPLRTVILSRPSKAATR